VRDYCDNSPLVTDQYALMRFSENIYKMPPLPSPVHCKKEIPRLGLYFDKQIQCSEKNLEEEKTAQ
jgi:hypothetical protein